MTEAHPEFWPLWCEDILQLGEAQDTATVDVLRQFLSEMRPMLEAIDSTSGHEDILRRETEALLDGLKRHLWFCSQTTRFQTSFGCPRGSTSRCTPPPHALPSDWTGSWGRPSRCCKNCPRANSPSTA